MSCLVRDKFASVGLGPILVPVYGQCSGSVLSELSLIGASQVLFIVVNIEIPGKLFVILSSVAGLVTLPTRFVALDTSIDDVDGRTKARVDTVPSVSRVGHPGPINDMQHAGLGRLGGHIEPGGGGKIEPSVCNKVRMIQKKTTFTKHGLAELAIVEVVTELLGSPAIVLLPFSLDILSTGPFLGQAVSLDAVVIVIASLT